jgi:Flp pilus assembly pilin Flp
LRQGEFSLNVTQLIGEPIIETAQVEARGSRVRRQGERHGDWLAFPRGGHMLATFRRFLGDQNGAATIKYGLMISLAFAGAIGVANEVGARIEFIFRGVADVINAATAGRPIPPPFI